LNSGLFTKGPSPAFLQPSLRDSEKRGLCIFGQPQESVIPPPIEKTGQHFLATIRAIHPHLLIIGGNVDRIQLIRVFRIAMK
jgi:hypothetical protein